MNKKIILGLILVLILILGFFYFQKEEKKNKERVELENFVKEHNASLKFKIENKGISRDVSKIDFGIKENKEREEKLFSLEEELAKEGIPFYSENRPYTKPLPEMPDEEENNSTLFGVDSNNNGVRDDLEIMIVKEFGGDEYMTELQFASMRANNYMLSLSESDYVNKNELQEVMDNSRIVSECEYFSDNYDYSKHKGFFNDLYNKSMNSLRKKARKKIFFGGMGSGVEVTKKQCLEFIQKTKDEYSNFN